MSPLCAPLRRSEQVDPGDLLLGPHAEGPGSVGNQRISNPPNGRDVGGMSPSGAGVRSTVTHPASYSSCTARWIVLAEIEAEPPLEGVTICTATCASGTLLPSPLAHVPVVGQKRVPTNFAAMPSLPFRARATIWARVMSGFQRTMQRKPVFGRSRCPLVVSPKALAGGRSR